MSMNSQPELHAVNWWFRRAHFRCGRYRCLGTSVRVLEQKSPLRLFLFIWRVCYVTFLLCLYNSSMRNSIAFAFGVVTVASGIIGVICGAAMGIKLRNRYPSAGIDNFRISPRLIILFSKDGIICGVGMLTSIPFFYAFVFGALQPLYVIYISAFIGLWCINLNWALVGDILLVGATFSL